MGFLSYHWLQTIQKLEKELADLLAGSSSASSPSLTLDPTQDPKSALVDRRLESFPASPGVSAESQVDPFAGLGNQSEGANAPKEMSRAENNTYTCTYHGCTERFSGMAALQAHKRSHKLSFPSIYEFMAYESPQMMVNRPSGGLPTLPGILGGKRVTPPADLGASENFMSATYARRNGYTVVADHANTAKIANSSLVDSMGIVTLPYVFEGDSVSYMQQFRVLRKCVHDVILGAPFLRMTKTFTRFKERIQWTAHSLLSRVMFIGDEQQYLPGWFNCEEIRALPDSCSSVMLVSEEYARSHALQVLRSPEYCVRLRMGDGSTAQTCGMVKDATWRYGIADEEIKCDFYVLKDLSCDVILSCDFLYETNVFERFPWLFETEAAKPYDGDSRLNIIVRLETKVQRLKSRAGSLFRKEDNDEHTVASQAQEATLEQERRKLLQRMERVCQLPESRQSAEMAAIKEAWARNTSSTAAIASQKQRGTPGSPSTTSSSKPDT